jgi:hypothetical protein
MSHYRFVVIETFRNSGEASTSSLRCRPLPGQGFSNQMRVECSSKMRDKYPVGTCFLIKAQIIDKDGGNPFLYTYYNWPYEVLSKYKAQAWINKKAK